ncbi:hypothetical protein DRO61_03780 [Candidatus Bathyarchaeota archaeon]|nr:MAG: hypothetical protein DRO61_03780 [Candidatus Bathyarchaeota archaeon]
MSDKCKARYVVEQIDCDNDNRITPNERVWKIRDLQTDHLGFASYMTEERAKVAAERKNWSP